MCIFASFDVCYFGMEVGGFGGDGTLVLGDGWLVQFFILANIVLSRVDSSTA